MAANPAQVLQGVDPEGGGDPPERGTDQLKIFKHVFDSYHDDIFKNVFRLGLVLRQASKKLLQNSEIQSNSLNLPEGEPTN